MQYTYKRNIQARSRNHYCHAKAIGIHFLCVCNFIYLACSAHAPYYTECFIMFSVITKIYNKKTKGPTLMEFFTATGKLKKFF